MMDFPTPSYVGQRETLAGRTWEWNGRGWLLIPVVESGHLKQLTALTPTDGDLIMYDDSSSSWIASKNLSQTRIDGGNF